MSTISTNGIAPSSIIRAEHVLRIINALINVANTDILISGSLVVTGSTAITGSFNVVGGITGSSANLTNVLTLIPNNPLPSNQPTGSISVSGSGANCKPYFWNGATWTLLI